MTVEKPSSQYRWDALERNIFVLYFWFDVCLYVHKKVWEDTELAIMRGHLGKRDWREESLILFCGSFL
jgi:hypothetical protein